MKRTRDLTLDQMTGLIDRLCHHMYWDEDEGQWSPDQDVNGGDLIELVDQELVALGLRPEEGDVAPPVLKIPEPDEASIERVFQFTGRILRGQYDQWRTSCPSCGGDLHVYEVTLARTGEKYYPDEPLESDGFFFATDEDGDASTEDERVRCVKCAKAYDLSDLELDKG